MYLTDIYMSAEIDEYPSLRFQDIRKKPKVTDVHTNGRPYHKVCVGWGGGGIKNSVTFSIVSVLSRDIYQNVMKKSLSRFSH